MRNPETELSAPRTGDGARVDSPRRGNGIDAKAHAPLQEVGFIGLGRMGTAMAANLAAAGFRVRAHVRHQERMAELAALGLSPSTDISKVLDCEIVITMLPDDRVVREIVFGRDGLEDLGLAGGMLPGAIHLSMSTISTAAASQFAAKHATSGQSYVAAPVFGNPDAARARELLILAAGAVADIGRCRSVFAALGQQTFVIGSDPAAANLVKLAGNVLTATALEMLGETMALLRKRGLDPAAFLNIVTQTLFSGRVHKIYGEKIANERYAPSGFVLPLALKDVRLALAEAEAAAVPMPSVGVVRDRLIAGIARGHADLDWTALGLIATEEAGLHSSPAGQPAS
jgi:3-hydroxyisobutyrate dehydrogenase-like beta-hydroxyacid dehydrogenase